MSGLLPRGSTGSIVFDNIRCNSITSNTAITQSLQATAASIGSLSISNLSITDVTINGTITLPNEPPILNGDGIDASNNSTLMWNPVTKEVNERLDVITYSGTQPMINKTINTTTNNILVHSASDTNINSLLNQPVLTTSSPTFSGLTVMNGATNKTALVSAAATTTSQAIFPDGIGYVVMRDLAQTLTNKTLTSPVISNIVNTGTLTLPTSTDTLVGRATSDDLTNKRLFSGSSWFVNDADTTKSFTILNYGSTGTSVQLQSAPTANRVVEIPDATTVLVGTGTTQTLTNKTIAYGSNTITGLPVSSTGYAAYYVLNNTLISNVVDTITPYDTAIATDSGVSNSAGTFTINTSGTYTIVATIGYLVSGAGFRRSYIKLNSSNIQYGQNRIPGSAVYDGFMVSSFTANLTAGDTIKVMTLQSSGGNLTLIGYNGFAGTSMTMVQITRIS